MLSLGVRREAPEKEPRIRGVLDPFVVHRVGHVQQASEVDRSLMQFGDGSGSRRVALELNESVVLVRDEADRDSLSEGREKLLEFLVGVVGRQTCNEDVSLVRSGSGSDCRRRSRRQQRLERSGLWQRIRASCAVTVHGGGSVCARVLIV